MTTLWALPLLLCAFSACRSDYPGNDVAEREYVATQRGIENGQYMSIEQRIAHLDHAIRMRPDRAYYWETRAGCYWGLGDFARAKADYDRAIELVDRPYSRFLRGLLLCKTGDYRAARVDFDVAIVAQPANWQFYRGRALARLSSGRLAAALADAETVVAREPMAQSYYVRGIVRAALAQHQAAIADFDQAHRIFPDLVYVLQARAASYEQLGDTARAAADRALAADKTRERINWAQCLDPFMP